MPIDTLSYDELEDKYAFLAAFCAGQLGELEPDSGVPVNSQKNGRFDKELHRAFLEAESLKPDLPSHREFIWWLDHEELRPAACAAMRAAIDRLRPAVEEFVHRHARYEISSYDQPAAFNRGIPGHDQDGFLPPGSYITQWPEFSERFGWNEQRQALLSSAKALFVWLAHLGCQNILVGGSFVTSKKNPGDMDCYWEDIDGIIAKSERLLSPGDQGNPPNRHILRRYFGVDFLAKASGGSYIESVPIPRDRDAFERKVGYGQMHRIDAVKVPFRRYTGTICLDLTADLGAHPADFQPWDIANGWPTDIPDDAVPWYMWEDWQAKETDLEALKAGHHRYLTEKQGN